MAIDISKRKLHNHQTDKELMLLRNIAFHEIRSVKNNDEFVAHIRRIILENMKEEGFGVPVLCKMTCMSRTQLHVKLNSLTRHSTSQYIKSIRIQRACELLGETNLKISRISKEIGIDSLPYFSRIFKKEVGLSPHKYRKKYRSEQ